jgi:alpha-L-fucosidase 2
MPLPIALAGLSIMSTFNHPIDPQRHVWFNAPAKDWNEALPLGNGKTGAMVFGTINEKIQLNDATFWAGHPHDYSNPEAHKSLAEIQRMIFAGKENEATALASKSFMGSPPFQAAYQPIGDLLIEPDNTKGVSDFFRSLDVRTGISTVTYTVEGIGYSRESFVSAADGVLVIRISADKPNALSTQIRLVGPYQTALEHGSKGLLAKGQWKDDGQKRAWTASWDKPGIKYAVAMKPRATSGAISEDPQGFKVTNASELVLILATDTSHVNYQNIQGDPESKVAQCLERASKKSFTELRARHLKDLSKYLDRVTIDLPRSPDSDLPTPERLSAYRINRNDPALAALYFNYGRYLLVSSSRPGGQPANLQGIWNKDTGPAWGSKYTTNINLQMNYWPAEVTNLTETTAPLFSLIEDLRITGGKAAKDYYNAKGWVLHHNTDLWRGAAPVDGVWGVWPMGSAWLALHSWEHYLFTRDTKFLKDTAYPQMRGAAEFVLDFLKEGPKGSKAEGKLVTNPSHSPENAFTKPDGTRSQFTYGATMDLQICREILQSSLAAAKDLNLKPDAFAEAAANKLANLMPVQISPKTGRLQEWVEDYDEPEPGHRHMSHLFGLHPGTQITADSNSEMFKAARKSLEHRLANGGGGTGWSRAWLVNFFARLADPKGVQEHLDLLFIKSTQNNLLDSHPPFQIDGNFGATAGIAEALIQSHELDKEGIRIVRIIPALPTTWTSGSLKGIKARGGLTFGFVWRDSRVVEVNVKASKPISFHLRTPLVDQSLTLKANESISIRY